MTKFNAAILKCTFKTCLFLIVLRETHNRLIYDLLSKNTRE